MCIDDHSRVVLNIQDNTAGSDYINASIVNVSIMWFNCGSNFDFAVRQFLLVHQI